jgi:hypothetical protein
VTVAWMEGSDTRQMHVAAVVVHGDEYMSTAEKSVINTNGVVCKR